jgi:hypothetical protein
MGAGLGVEAGFILAQYSVAQTEVHQQVLARASPQEALRVIRLLSRLSSRDRFPLPRTVTSVTRRDVFPTNSEISDLWFPSGNRVQY